MTFPERPEDTPEGFIDSFLRISGPAWVVYLVFRIISTDWFERSMKKSGFNHPVILKSSIMFFSTLLVTYFTASFRTRVFVQSVV
jgi:hypothetical protein